MLIIFWKIELKKKILIFRTDRIGDFLISCPTILAIKNYFDESSIDLVASEKNNLYAKELGIFESIYVYPKKNILKKINFFFFILKKKFDYIFVLDGKDRSLIPILFNSCKKNMSYIQKNKIPIKYLILHLLKTMKNQ